jgi:hypothetical protein
LIHPDEIQEPVVDPEAPNRNKTVTEVQNFLTPIINPLLTMYFFIRNTATSNDIADMVSQSNSLSLQR